MTSRLALLFRAASEPVRLQILELLRDGTLCVCDLQNRLGLPQPTVSRHLAALRHAGLVRDRRDGPRVLYSLAPAETGLEKAFLHLLGRMWELDLTLPQTIHGPVSKRQATANRRANEGPARRIVGNRFRTSRSRTP